MWWTAGDCCSSLQGWMLLIALLLGALTLLNLTTPWTLLLLTFLLGVGAATNAPAWQSCIPELVPREDLPGAVRSASVGFNLARAVGPALGGLAIAASGPGGAFVLNAVSFVGVMVVLYRWRHTREQERLPQRFVAPFRAGCVTCVTRPAFAGVLVRSRRFHSVRRRAVGALRCVPERTGIRRPVTECYSLLEPRPDGAGVLPTCACAASDIALP